MKAAVARQGNQEVQQKLFAMLKDFRPVMVQTWNKTVESLSANQCQAELDSIDDEDREIRRRNMLKECLMFFNTVWVTTIKTVDSGKIKCLIS